MVEMVVAVAGEQPAGDKRRPMNFSRFLTVLRDVVNGPVRIDGKICTGMIKHFTNKKEGGITLLECFLKACLQPDIILSSREREQEPVTTKKRGDLTKDILLFFCTHLGINSAFTNQVLKGVVQPEAKSLLLFLLFQWRKEGGQIEITPRIRGGRLAYEDILPTSSTADTFFWPVDSCHQKTAQEILAEIESRVAEETAVVE